MTNITLKSTLTFSGRLANGLLVGRLRLDKMSHFILVQDTCEHFQILAFESNSALTLLDCLVHHHGFGAQRCTENVVQTYMGNKVKNILNNNE
jgi:hypothetical protein